MKCIRRRILNAALAVLVLSPLPAYAHGGYIHDLDQLAQHLAEHIRVFESLAASPSADPELLFRQFEEIRRHAVQYRQLARQMKAEHSKLLVAEVLERISDRLQETAQNRDAVASLELMKKLEVLVQPAG